MPNISLCGVLLHTHCAQMDRVVSILSHKPGVEVHAATDDGRLVVTVEGENLSNTGARVSALQDIEGVLSASMVYQYNDEVEDMNEECL